MICLPPFHLPMLLLPKSCRVAAFGVGKLFQCDLSSRVTGAQSEGRGGFWDELYCLRPCNQGMFRTTNLWWKPEENLLASQLTALAAVPAPHCVQPPTPTPSRTPTHPPIPLPPALPAFKGLGFRRIGFLMRQTTRAVECRHLWVPPSGNVAQCHVFMGYPAKYGDEMSMRKRTAANAVICLLTGLQPSPGTYLDYLYT